MVNFCTIDNEWKTNYAYTSGIQSFLQALVVDMLVIYTLLSFKIAFIWMTQT